MEKETYEAPTIQTIGSLRELTQQAPDKCGGTSDLLAPTLQLTPRFGDPHCD